jgi:hypothetical protein
VNHQPVEYAYQRIRSRVWQGPDQHGVQHTENCGIRANAQRKRKQSRDAESGPGSDHPHGMTRIPQHTFDECERVHAINLLSAARAPAGSEATVINSLAEASGQ